MANPAFSQSPAFGENARNAVAVPPVPPAPSASELDAQFAIPAATADEMGRMTYQDTIVKTVISFVGRLKPSNGPPDWLSCSISIQLP